MKKIHAFLTVAVVCIAAFAPFERAVALSHSEMQALSQKNQAYANARASLDAALKALRTANPERLQDILDDQRQWDRSWQDSLVSSMIAAHKQGRSVPGSVLANNRVDKTLAYAKVTAERAHIIGELVKQAQSPTYGVGFTGRLGQARHPMMGGMFTVTPEGWWTSITICFFWEKDSLGQQSQRELGLPVGSSVNVRGRLRSAGGFVANSSLSVSGI